MIIELEPEQDTAFETRLHALYENISDVESVQKLRLKAWERFLELGLPTRSNDVYRYVPLKKLFTRELEAVNPTEVSFEQVKKYILPECENSVLVFINGRFSSTHSRTSAISTRVSMTTFEEALATYGSFINAQWTKTVKEELDPFALLNLSMHRDGLFIYIPPKTVLEAPVQLLHIADVNASHALLSPRAQVFAGANAEVALVSTQGVISGETYFCNGSLEIAVEEGAHVHYTQSACDVSKGVWLFDAFRATMKRNSTLKTVMATEGSTSIRHDYRVALIGENAELELNGVAMVQQNNESHVHVLVDHQAPNCRSLQLFKCVLNDFGHSAFEGKILVKQAAQKTEAFQLNNNLLLSDRAHADSKPNLEIFADDVKASHGSTVGQLDSEQIYYMKTRGFSEAMAKNLLVKGYCAEVIDKVKLGSISTHLRRKAAAFLI